MNQSAAPLDQPAPAMPLHIKLSTRYVIKSLRSQVLCLCFLAMFFSSSWGQESSSQTAPSDSKKTSVVDFARDIAPMLKNKCMHCHEGSGAKNGFIVADKEAFMGYIEAGNAGASTLWTDYLTQPSRSVNKDSLVMPPDEPLTPAELALFKVWIDDGAAWPTEFKLNETATSNPSETDATERSLLQKIYLACGYFHPAVVHFPIALFLLSAGCSLLSYFLGARCQSIAFQCLALASLSSIVTVVMGWSFAETQGYPDWKYMLSSTSTHQQENFFWHRWLGTSTVILGTLCIGLALLARKNKSTALSHVWRFGTVLLGLLIGIIGHQGGELVYGDLFDKAMKIFNP